MSHIRSSIVIPASRGIVFDYLTNLENLPGLLQESLDVELVNVRAPLKRGSEYSLVMTRFGLSQNVRLRVENVVSGQSVTYRQIVGLFQKWVHTQLFEDHGESGTVVTDIVEYRLPLGLIGYLLDDLLVRRDMKEILDRRLRRAAAYFEGQQAKVASVNLENIEADSTEPEPTVGVDPAPKFQSS